jgi:serine/threonine-protein kinase RsbW
MRQKSALLDTVISALRQLHLTRDEELRVRLCLDEAITNAIRHGNRHDPNRFVAAELRAQPHRWTITVTDEGTGFTPCDIPDPEDAAALLRETGRGLLLIREFMDEVAFYRDGRCIWMARHTVEAPEDAATPGATPGLEERCFRLQPGDPHGMILIPCGVPCLDDAACIRGESQVEEICEAAGTQVVVVDLGPVQLLTDASIGLLLNLRREL